MKDQKACTVLQVDDNEIVATLCNILEFESGIAPNEQQLWHNNKLLQPRQAHTIAFPSRISCSKKIYYAIFPAAKEKSSRLPSKL